MQHCLSSTRGFSKKNHQHVQLDEKAEMTGNGSFFKVAKMKKNQILVTAFFYGTFHGAPVLETLSFSCFFTFSTSWRPWIFHILNRRKHQFSAGNFFNVALESFQTSYSKVQSIKMLFLTYLVPHVREKITSTAQSTFIKKLPRTPLKFYCVTYIQHMMFFPKVMCPENEALKKKTLLLRHFWAERGCQRQDFRTTLLLQEKALLLY